MSDPKQKVFANFVNGMTRFTPAERAEILLWVAECYCMKCGYPAPPSGIQCVGCASEAPAPVPQQQTTGSEIPNNCPQNTTQEKT